MDRTELYLKTAFCCMACDGNIAPQEIEIIQNLPMFATLNWQEFITKYVDQLKNTGVGFLQQYLDELKAANLNEEEECLLANIAIQTIEADNEIEYNEIAFFKKIRKQLNASDKALLNIIHENPNEADQISPEDYLQPDINNDMSTWSDTLNKINFIDIKQNPLIQ